MRPVLTQAAIVSLACSEENYIDLDRMLVEKAGKFDWESFNMTEGPIMPSRIHKYDFSDPTVIEVIEHTLSSTRSLSQPSSFRKSKTVARKIRSHPSKSPR